MHPLMLVASQLQAYTLFLLTLNFVKDFYSSNLQEHTRQF